MHILKAIFKGFQNMYGFGGHGDQIVEIWAVKVRDPLSFMKKVEFFGSPEKKFPPGSAL